MNINFEESYINIYIKGYKRKTVKIIVNIEREKFLIGKIFSDPFFFNPL